MIRIAQASSSENFTKYGVAPNQRRTGVTKDKPGGNMDGELNVVNFSGGWECVYRPLDPEVADRIATFMEKAVANGSGIGYSWEGFTGLFDALKKLGSTDPADVKTPVNTDCTGLLGSAIYFGGGIKDERLRTLTTAKCEEILMSTNAFTKISTKELCQEGKGIRRGDCLWRTGHVAVALDTDTSFIHVSLTNDGLKFEDANGKTTGNYPNNVKMDELLYYQKFTFNSVSITAGTPGTRAAQSTRAIGKAGYRVLDTRLASVSNSALADVRPFIGGGDDSRLYVNFYRASGSSGKVDCTVYVIYIRSDVTI